jgi:hypothetical protein
MAHPQYLGDICVKEEQIGKFSKIKVYARIEGTRLPDDRDGNMVVELSSPEHMIFIYEH